MEKTYGGSDSEWAEAAVVDGSYLYVIGTTYSDDAGAGDISLLKIATSDGSVSWDRAYGTASHTEEGYGVDVDANGNVYFAGTQTESGGETHAIVAKYNSSGTKQWDYKFGNSNKVDYVYGADVAGSYLYTAGYTTDNDSDGDAFAAKIDVSAITPSISWAKYVGHGSYTEAGNDIAVDSSGNVYVTGASSFYESAVTFKLNSGGTYQWHHFMLDSVGYSLETDGSYIYVGGMTRQSQDADPDNNVMYVKHTSGSGTLSTSKYWGANLKWEGAYGIAFDGTDLLYFAGYAPDYNGGSSTWTSFGNVDALAMSYGSISWSLSSASGSSSSIGRSTSTISGGAEDDGSSDPNNPDPEVLVLKYDLNI